VGGIAQGIGTGVAGVAQAAATKSAATTEANAARYAAQQQYQAAQNALNLQQNVFNQQQQNIAPWLQAGTGALSQLTAGTQPGGIFGQQQYPTFQPTGAAQAALQPAAFTPTGAALTAVQPGTFQAPTAEEAAAMPGYQFAFNQGLEALQRSQAATGITGGAAAKAAEQYGQGLASTNYQNAYNQALNTYTTNQAAAQNALAAQQGLYGLGQNVAQQALTGQTGVYGTQYDVQRQLLSDYYNRLAGLSGTGQTAGQNLATAAGAYGTGAGNLLTGMGAVQAGGTMGAAQAGAAGTLGLGQAFGNLATGLGQAFGSPTGQRNALLQSYQAQPQLGSSPGLPGQGVISPYSSPMASLGTTGGIQLPSSYNYYYPQSVAATGGVQLGLPSSSYNYGPAGPPPEGGQYG
jgi:hypothetical protein